MAKKHLRNFVRKLICIFPNKENAKSLEALKDVVEDKCINVVKVISEIFEGDAETLILILHELTIQEEKFGSRDHSPQWKMLNDLIDNKTAFKNYADGLVKEKKYEKVVNAISEIYAGDSESLLYITNELGFQEEKDGFHNHLPQWKTLYDLIDNKTAFKNYADEIVKKKKYEKVVGIISEIYAGNNETLTLILLELAALEEKAGSRDLSPQWKMLSNLIQNKTAFKNYADGLVKEKKYEKVVSVISEIYAGDGESLLYITNELAIQEEKAGSRDLSPRWKMLYDLSGKKDAFKTYVDGIIKKAREKKTREILQDANKFIEKITNESITNSNVINTIDNNRQLISTLFPGGAIIWLKLPYSAKVSILNFVSTTVQNLKQLSILASNGSINGVIAKISLLASHGKLVCVGLAAIPIMYETFRSIYLWYHGKISGKRAAKAVTQVSLSTACGFGGAVAGAAIGGISGPVGAIIGGIAGGIGASIIGGAIAKSLCKKIFNLPKTQALEDAYKYLGIHHKASNSEVIAAFKKRALMDHPDKESGNHEAFCKLHAYITIIRISRGEMVLN